jgi:eukaryotic-like serine/threonine-protein kinase
MVWPQGTFAGTKRFEILARLGSGGMGVVYEALDRQRSTKVALKTLPGVSPDGLLRLKNEFHALQGIHHPNLVTLGELICEDGQWFFTMELIEGQDFSSYVRPSDPGLDEWRLRAALSQLAEGLIALHAAQKIHRDIKPSNILVTRAARVVLLDFGLAQDMIDSDRHKESSIFGTAAYMAPEQAASKAIGPEADWYSVGVVLYQALTGRLPITGEPLDVLLKKQTSVPKPARELAPEVPEDLDRLARDLLSIDPKARPKGEEVLRRLGVTTGPIAPKRASAELHRFVGRKIELGALENAFRRVVSSGLPEIVIVRGESGIGKSTLLRRFMERLAAYGALTLFGRCYERESVPYKALDGIIDELTDHLRRLPVAEAAALLPRKAALLLRVFPVLGRIELFARSRMQAVTEKDPQELRARVFAALRELMLRLADRQPLVLVIDDLQWADEDSFALLTEVLRAPEAPPLLLVAATRDAPPDSRIEDPAAALTRAGAGLSPIPQILRLGPLPAQDARELAWSLMAAPGTRASSMPPSPPAPVPSTPTADVPDLADAIAGEADGHPLFIDELVVYWRSDVSPSSQKMRLEDALFTRIGSLVPRARHVLSLVSVSTVPVPQDTIARAAEIGFDELAKVIGSLRGANLIRLAGFHGADSIEPYHDRVRVTVLRDLGPDQRKALHLRLAIALETSGRRDAEALAIHWEGAGERAKALDHAVRAAEEAVSALAFDRAAGLFRWAKHLAAGLGGDRGGELQIALATALAFAGRGAEAAEAYLAAAKAARSADQVMDLERRAAEQLLRSGHIDRGLEVVERILRQLGMKLANTPTSALMSLLFHRARLRIRGLGYERRTAEKIPARELARIDVTWSVAAALGMVDPIRGAELETRNLIMSLDAGEPTRIARSLAIEACFSAANGVPSRKRTAELVAAARGLAHEVQSPHAIGLSVHAASLEAFFQGKFQIARALEEEAETIFLERCQGAPWEVTNARLFHLSSLAYLGEIDELARRLPHYLKDALERGDLYRATDFRTGPLNLAWLAHDDAETARKEAEEAITRWSRKGFHVQHYDHLIAVTQIDLYLGNGAAAHERARQIWPALARSLLMHVQLIKVDALFLRARSALAAGRADLWDGVLADAKAIAKEKMPWSEGLVLLLRASVAAARAPQPRSSAIAAELAHAESAFDAHEMALHSASVKRQRGRLMGGDEGLALIAEADAWFAKHKVLYPAKMARIIAPGFFPD